MEVLKPASAQQFLFHYTTRERTLEGILAGTPSLRLGRFTETKDPYESKDWNFGIESGSDDWSIERRIWDASLQLQKSLRLICLTQDSFSADGPNPVEMRGFGLSRMWDRYGEGHKGMCLAFDRHALARAVGLAIDVREPNPVKRMVLGPPTWWAQEVTYDILANRPMSEWSVDGLHAKARSEHYAVVHHLAVNYQRLLFLKSKDWEGEREFRHVYWGEPQKPDLDIPITGSLRAVFLGVDFPSVYLPALQAVLPQGAMIFEMRWNWGHFLDPKPA